MWLLAVRSVGFRCQARCGTRAWHTAGRAGCRDLLRWQERSRTDHPQFPPFALRGEVELKLNQRPWLPHPATPAGVLYEFAGTMAVYGDVDRKLQRCMDKMKVGAGRGGRTPPVAALAAGEGCCWPRLRHSAAACTSPRVHCCTSPGAGQCSTARVTTQPAPRVAACPAAAMGGGMRLCGVPGGERAPDGQHPRRWDL